VSGRQITRSDNGKRRHGRTCKNWLKIVQRQEFTSRVGLTPSSALNSEIMADSYTEAVCYNRKKDQESTTGKWFAELIKPNPWYKKVVPNVSSSKQDLFTSIAHTRVVS
jgi:hypothetical protein